MSESNLCLIFLLTEEILILLSKIPTLNLHHQKLHEDFLCLQWFIGYENRKDWANIAQLGTDRWSEVAIECWPLAQIDQVRSHCPDFLRLNRHYLTKTTYLYYINMFMIVVDSCKLVFGGMYIFQRSFSTLSSPFQSAF